MKLGRYLGLARYLASPSKGRSEASANFIHHFRGVAQNSVIGKA